jgi:acetyl esterase/lipase
MRAIGKIPDVRAVGVGQFGILNWVTMLQHEDPLLQQYENLLPADPENDCAAYEADSPLAYQEHESSAARASGPQRLPPPKEEAEQVVKILQDAGKRVDAHYYPNECHGFAKRENQVDAIRRTIDWFDKYLKGAK